MSIRRLTTVLFTKVALLFPLADSARSQTSLDEIEASLAGKSRELERVDSLLADQDRNRRIAAMEALLASGNPVFVSRAKESGLFSSDRELREAALKATLDSGGPFRLIISLSEADEKSEGLKWVTRYGSLSNDGKTGYLSFGTTPYDPKAKCWKFEDIERCAMMRSGTSVSLVWPTGRGNLTLDTDGALTGSFIVDGATAALPAQIPLFD